MMAATQPPTPKLRKSMCDKKVSFRSKGKAEAVAAKFGQRIYECPICFCWHCTSKEDWQQEFVSTADLRRAVAEARCEMAAKRNAKLKQLRQIVNCLHVENKCLKKLNAELLKASKLG